MGTGKKGMRSNLDTSEDGRGGVQSKSVDVGTCQDNQSGGEREHGEIQPGAAQNVDQLQHKPIEDEDLVPHEPAQDKNQNQQVVDPHKDDSTDAK